MRAFITGTDTGVGKTYATALLARALRAAGHDTIALKPVCCGDREDAHVLREACDNLLSLDDVNPVHLALPASPLAAAAVAGRRLTVGGFVEWFSRVGSGRESVLVEGAGGWFVPLAPGVTMADLAKALGLPVVVVVANRLGCINHTLLTVHAVRATGLVATGLVLNTVAGDPTDESVAGNRAQLEEFSGLPVIAEIGYKQEAISPAIVRNASRGSAAAEIGLPTTR